METKALGRVQVKSADEGIVMAVFSTFGVIDKDGDVVLPGAFTEGAAVKISAYGHGSWSGMLPVGKGTIHNMGTEAHLDGRLFMDTQAGRETFTVIRELGPLQEWSYSLQNIRSTMGSWGGKRARIISQVDVHEVSPVMQGASINTRTLATKACEGCTRRHQGQDFRAEMLSIRKQLEAEMQRELQGEYLKYLRAESLSLGVKMEESGPASDPARIPDNLVPEETRRLAKTAAELAAADLSTSVPEIFWYRSRKTLGWARKGYQGEIWIHADLKGGQLLRIVGHEVAHTAGRGESDALSYEDHFMREVLR